MTTANILTLVRIAMIPLFLVFASLGSQYYLVAAIIFAVGSLTDSLDGYIARHYNQVTDFGKLTDPIADKLLVMSALLVFVESGIMPVWVAAVIIGREFIISGLRMIAAAKGIVIAAAKSGKAKTFVQCIGIILIFVLGDDMLSFSATATVQTVTVYIMAAVSVISCVDYFITNRGVLRGSLDVQKK